MFNRFAVGPRAAMLAGGLKRAAVAIVVGLARSQAKDRSQRVALQVSDRRAARLNLVAPWPGVRLATQRHGFAMPGRVLEHASDLDPTTSESMFGGRQMFR